MLKALILNSGMGSRMGSYTAEHPKCMTELNENDTILSRQLKLLCDIGVEEAVITTGYYDVILKEYCESLKLPIRITFVHNQLFSTTNYIYSIYCAKELLQDCDLLLMHGDLVFDRKVLQSVADNDNSCMTVSSTVELPEKDFKAVISDGRITAVGIEFFESAMAAQPLYKLLWNDWKVWLAEIEAFCTSDNVRCYAENAFNVVSDKCMICPFDVRDMLCGEVDTPEDLAIMTEKLKALS